MACDSSAASLELAREKHPIAEYFQSGRPEELISRCGPVDLIFISCVLHHIPPQERGEWLSALGQALSPGGATLIFEHNPWNPVTRRIFNRCQFDHGASLVYPRQCCRLLLDAGLKPVKRGFYLLSPWRNAVLDRMERMLAFVPLGGQYFVLAARLAKTAFPG